MGVREISGIWTLQMGWNLQQPYTNDGFPTIAYEGHLLDGKYGGLGSHQVVLILFGFPCLVSPFFPVPKGVISPFASGSKVGH